MRNPNGSGTVEPRYQIFCYDPVNIRQVAGWVNRTPHLWRAWTIEDRERPTVRGARSELSLYEYDCGTNRFRVVHQELYPDPMAGGRRLDRITRPSDWIGVISNTAPKLLGDIVCEDFQGAKQNPVPFANPASRGA